MKQLIQQPVEPQIHGGNVWRLAEQSGIAVEEVIDFSANINPLGPSPYAVAAISEAVPFLHHYPETQGDQCVSALSEYLDVPKAQLILGNGAAELIYLLGRMYYQTRLLRLAPTFSEYGQGLEAPVCIDFALRREDQFALPLAEIQQEMQAGDVLFVGNPNNPTGKLFTREDMMKLAEAALQKSVTLVIDEAFIDFCPNHRDQSMRYFVERYPNMVIVGSLTKFFAIPALRLGYAVAHQQLIERMQRLLPPWRVNLPALLAGEASMTDERYIQETLSYVCEERRWFTRELRKISGFRVYEGAANFLLVNSQQAGITAEFLYKRLKKYGILIRLCHSFTNLSAYDFRLAVRKREENQRLLAVLQQITEGRVSKGGTSDGASENGINAGGL